MVKRNPDEYKGCVSLAVSRLSRVCCSNKCRDSFEKLNKGLKSTGISSSAECDLIIKESLNTLKLDSFYERIDIQ